MRGIAKDHKVAVETGRGKTIKKWVLMLGSQGKISRGALIMLRARLRARRKA